MSSRSRFGSDGTTDRHVNRMSKREGVEVMKRLIRSLAVLIACVRAGARQAGGQHADPAREDQGGQKTSGGAEHGIDGVTWLKYCGVDIGAVILK